MADELDLTEAVAVADKAWGDLYFKGRSNKEAREAAVRAAAPLIATQVRAQIAADIEAVRDRYVPDAPIVNGLSTALRIARGDAR